MGSKGVHIREVPLNICTIVTMYHTVSGQLDFENFFSSWKLVGGVMCMYFDLQ